MLSLGTLSANAILVVLAIDSLTRVMLFEVYVALGHPETHFKLCIRTLQHGWSKPGGHSTICSAMRTWVGCWLLTLDEEASKYISL